MTAEPPAYRAPNEPDPDQPLKDPRLEKLAGLRALGVDPYPYRFDPTHRSAELHATYEDLPADTETEDRVVVAGRIRALRNSGMFIDLHDTTGKIQIFSHKDFLDDHNLAVMRLLDIGDMLGVEGIVRRTKRGELSVSARKLTVLAKALLPLPEKYHGLADIEARYRQRYLDLIMNEDSRATLRIRSKVVAAMRAVMESRDFLEVETPMLHPILGGATARPFTTHHNTLDMDLYLRVAPELYLKKLVVGGLAERVYEINRCFRNEGISPRHNPEFTTLESYEAFADFTDVMGLVESLFEAACRSATGGTTAHYRNQEITFAGPYRRRSMTDLVTDATGVDFLALDADGARSAAADLGCKVTGGEKWGHSVELAFEAKVEDTLVQPTHVTHLPVDISPLAKKDPNDPRLTERFETYVNGWEVANAFTELTDPQDQFERFMEQVAAREGGDDEAQMMDRDYVTALEYGLVPTGGLGVGIDRLVMLMTDSQSIRDVIAFPTLRPRT